MKKQIFFLSFLLMAVVAFAQPIDDGWVEIGNASNNSELYDIDFISPTTGFAIGTGGAFLKTIDGGNTWSTYDIGVGFSLWQLQFTSSSVGYIIGGNNVDGDYFGKILRTSDGGISWTEVYSQTSELSDMYFINDSTGWVSAYELVLQTTNSGATWTPVACIGYTIYNIWFVSALKGYYSGVDSKVYNTTDGGNVWTEKFSGETLNDLWFRDPQHGYYLNSIRQLKVSTDSGNTWTWAYTFPEQVKNVRFINQDTGYVLNYAGDKIFQSIDAGTTWQLIYEASNENLNDIEVESNGRLYVVGKGAFAITTNNGVVWDTLHEGSFSGYLNDVQFINNQIGIAVGDNGKVKRTTDGGNTWVTEAAHPYKNLKGVSCFDSTAVFIAGEDSLILKSTDSGQTWNSSATGFNLTSTKGIEMYSATEGFAFGITNVYKTNDGGASWTVSGILGNIRCASVLGNDSVYLAGNSEIQYTYDGGTTWVGPNYFSQIGYGLFFLSADTGFIVNSWGRVLKTTDRGVNWNQTLNAGPSLYAITFVDDTTGYIVGHNGKILKTTNRGATWNVVECPTQRSLRAIWFTPDGTGYIVGQDGIILRKSMVPVYQVDFSVTNDDSDVLANATMHFNGSTYPVGDYTVVGLEAGSYNYIFSCPGHRSDTGIVVISSDTAINIELKKFHSVSIDVINYFNSNVGMAGVLFNGDSLVTAAGSGVAFPNVVKGAACSVQILANHYLPYLTSVDINGDTSFIFVLDADISAPVVQTVTGLNDHGFTAEWTAGLNADEYALFVSADNFATYIAGYDSAVVTTLSEIISGLTPGLTYYFRLRSVNAYGVSDYSNTGTAMTTTGIGEENATTILIYPNPATDFIDVNFSGQLPGFISIYDAYGRQLTEQRATNKNRIVVSEFPCGIYYLHCGETVSTFVVTR